MNVNSLRKKIEYLLKVLLLFFFFLGLFILSQEFFIRFDFTQSQKYTLQPPTQALIKRLKAPLQIYAFLPISAPIPYQELIAQWTDFLRELQLQHQNIDLRIYDTSEIESESDEILRLSKHFKIPLQKIARQENDQRTQRELPFAVLLTYLNGQIIITPPESPSELEFSFALQLKSLLDQRRKPKIGFIKGHGETDFLKSPLASRLIQRADIEPVDLPRIVNENSNRQAIPSERSPSERSPSERSPLDHLNLLVIFAPQIAFKPEETEMIKDFISKGGHLLFAADYRTQSPEFPSVWVLKHYGIESFFETLGISIQHRSVVLDQQHPALARLQRDATGQVLQSNHPLYVQTQSQGLLKDFEGLVCPMCPPILIQPTASKMCEPILKTYPSAQINADLRSLDYQKDGKLSDKSSAYDLSVICQLENQGSLMILGAANRFLSAHPKHLLAFEQMIDHLLGYDDLIALKHQSTQTATLKPSTAFFKTTFKAIMVFGPIVFLCLIQILFHLFHVRQRSIQLRDHQ